MASSDFHIKFAEPDFTFFRRKDADKRGKQQQREKANQASKREIRQVQAFNFRSRLGRIYVYLI